MNLQPRLIRYRDAALYCGMGESMFDSRIRPLIKHEIKDGSKYLAYDRIDLDEAIDQYIQRNGKPWAKSEEYEKCQKDNLGCNTIKKPVNGVSTSALKATVESGSVYKQALSKKLK